MSKSLSRWHNRSQSDPVLAAPIVIYESDSPEVTSLTDEQAFENAIAQNRSEEQARLAAQYPKPSTLAVPETVPFAGVENFETFEEWLKRQPKDQFEETEAA
jgi:hypothetical protein